MNYQLHYNKLIETRRNREVEKDVYYENHHIVMKSMGGTDDPENLVKLTAREHFLAHWLLWRIHRNRQTAYAFNAFTGFFAGKNFTNRPKITSARAYAEAREAYSKMHSERMKTRVITDAFRKNVGDAQRGKKKSDATKKKISDKKLGVKQGPISEHRSAALSLYMKKKHDTYREAVGFEIFTKECVHCKKSFETNTWGRFVNFCSKACASRSTNKKKQKVQVKNRESGVEELFVSISAAAKSLGIVRSVIYKNQHTIYEFKILSA